MWSTGTTRAIGLLLCLSASWLGAACQDEIWASDYDQSCSTDEDCVLVDEGDHCDRMACRCRPGVINVDALDAWERDLAELYTCESQVDCDCMAFEAYCNVDICSTREMTGF